MPRPPTRTTRARQAAAEPATSTSTEPEVESRGRSRQTRSIARRISSGGEKELQAAKNQRDSAIEKLANEDVTTTGDDTNDDSIEIGRRAATPPRRDTTGLDLDLGDDMFGNLDDSFELPQVDNSSLFGNSSHMKPRSRSRQSSIIRPQSRGVGATPLMSSSFNIGAFRRRAREPSILGTGRKSRADTTGLTATTTQDQEDSESELEDFMPEAESTPVNNRRRTRASVNQEQEAEAELPELSGSRKRKSAGAPEADAHAEKIARSDEANSDREAEVPAQDANPAQPDSESDSDLSELSSPTAPVRLPAQPATPNRAGSYMAPPASSETEASRDFWPDIHGLAKKRRIITHENDNFSNISSPPSLTHSPNYAQRPKSRGRSRTRKSPPPLTTADLANLLPKRRQQRLLDDEEASDEEMDTSGLGYDQDELSFLNARSTRRGNRSRAASARSGRSASRNAKQKGASSKTRSSKRRRTYGRSEDKENEDNEETEQADTSAFVPQAADETMDEGTTEVRSWPSLQKIAKKFEEVDKWEMSFESASEPDDEIDVR